MDRPVPLAAHGPDIPVFWYFLWALPIQSAASYGRAEPHEWRPVKVWHSRN